MTGIRKWTLVGWTFLLLVAAAGPPAAAEGDGHPTARAVTSDNNVWLTDWPAGTSITVIIDDDWGYDLGDPSSYLETATVTADTAGEATVRLQQTSVVLTPGHHVTAIGGPVTKQLLVPDLAVYTNADTGEVFGTIGIAPPIGDIGVFAFPDSGEVFRHTPAAASWRVNLSDPATGPHDVGRVLAPLPDGLQGSLLFTDVDDDEAEIPWFIAWRGVFRDDDNSVLEHHIDWLALNGITHGCNPPVNDNFCPTATVTRGQMAAFLTRALDLTDRLDDPFIDDNGSIFEADIERLAAAGITRGCNPPANDNFCPDDTVTRAQMAAFLVRALGYTDAGSGDLFADDNGLAFENDIDRLATAGVTRGCNPPDNDRFCPTGNVTREQMAAFLNRALEPN